MSEPTSTANGDTRRWKFYDPVRAFPNVPCHWDHHCIVAEFSMGIDAEGGGTEGEWSVKFYDFDQGKSWIAEPGPPALRIEAFGDGLAALRETGLLDLLTENAVDRITPDDFAALLVENGWHDQTAELRGEHPLRCPECHGTGFVDDIGMAPSESEAS